jgi:hypothetical protein
MFSSKEDRSVLRTVENNAVKEFKYKDLAPVEGQERHAIFYLGMSDHFPTWYDNWCERRVALLELDKEEKRKLVAEQG